MSDVPPDNGAPGIRPAAPPDTPVLHRSNFAPPPPGSEPPTFDDDALAEAMAAEVRPYTAQITLPWIPIVLPAEAEFGAPPSGAPVAAPADAAPPLAPVPAQAAPAPAVAPGHTPVASHVPSMGDDAQPSEEELRRALGGASTLETIERLEKELERISNGEPTILPVNPTPAAGVTLGVTPAPTPAAFEPIHPDAAPEAVASPAPVEPAPVGLLVAGATAPALPDSPLLEPAAPPGGEAWALPTPDEPNSTPPPVADGEPAPPAPGAGALAWLAPHAGSAAPPPPVAAAATTEFSPEPAVPEPVAPTPVVPERPGPGSYAPFSLEVDQSLIDPVAAATVASAFFPDAVAAPSALEGPATPSAAPEPEAPAAPEAPWWSAAEPAGSAWEATASNPGPAPTAGFPVPYSTEPPIGPESPDWLDAPPPVFNPPELVEPPAFVDTPPNAALDPVAPITANTMVGLPLPTAQPNIADRAELPPPPGYENIPIMSSDADLHPVPVTPAAFVPPAAPPAANERPALDHDDDDIDDVDRVTGAGAIPISSSGAAELLAPPSQPIPTNRLSEDQPALVDEKAKEPPAFEVETAGPEPTLLELRAGRAARLFWLWFAANSSVVSMGLGAVLLATGMSLRQSIIATLAGVAISFLPLGLGTLAGKWSGQPTMIVSRAAFGHAGNILPALLAVLTRLLWGGVLLWLLATAVAQVLVGAGLDAGLGATVWQLVGLVAGFVIATVIAVFGYGFVAKLQLVLSVVSGLLILGSAALTYQHLDFAKALTVPDGSWILVIPGAALVFGVVGLAWVHSSSDLARYQRPGSSGGSSMLWATFGATLPPFLLIVWGAMLAASDPALGKQLMANPLAAIASLLPAWYPAPLLIAAALGLLSGAVLTMYSGGFALQALGLRMRRNLGTLLAAILVLAAAAALLFVVTDFSSLLRDLIITAAVPVAAWAGIFAAEMMIRTRRFHTPSLLAPGGIYPQLRPLNFLALIVISLIGLGLVSSSIPGLEWEGFLYSLVGIDSKNLLAGSDAGVFVALLLGILVPLVGGIPAIRRQERAAVAG